MSFIHVKYAIVCTCWYFELHYWYYHQDVPLCSGLLGAHFAALALKSAGEPLLQWYTDQLVWKADELAQKLLPAFSSTTGLPYARVSVNTPQMCTHTEYAVSLLKYAYILYEQHCVQDIDTADYVCTYV